MRQATMRVAASWDEEDDRLRDIPETGVGPVDRADPEPIDARALYADLTGLLERLHRRRLDVVRLGLEGIGVVDINASQGLLLLSIGDGEVPVRDLLQRGYHQTSSASYNIKKLVDYGYLEQIRSIHDRRAVRLRLGESGHRVADRLRALDDRLAQIAIDEAGASAAMQETIVTLKKLDRIWDDFISFG